MKQVIFVTLSISAHYCAKWTAKGTTAVTQLQQHNLIVQCRLTPQCRLPQIWKYNDSPFDNWFNTEPAHLTTKPRDELIGCIGQDLLLNAMYSAAGMEFCDTPCTPCACYRVTSPDILN